MVIYGRVHEIRLGISGDYIAVFIDGQHEYTGPYKPSAPVENNEPSTSFSSEEEQHITRPGVFIKSLGNGEFCGTLSEVSDFAGDEGGYSNRECTIIVDKVDGEYKVVNIYNYMKKRYEL